MQETVTNATQQTEQWSFVLQQLVQWVLAGFAWIIPFAKQVFGFVLGGEDFWSLAGMSIVLLLPAGVFIAGLIGSVISLYTIPFRLGRSVTLMQSVVLAWWDALRMVWFDWAGLGKFLFELVTLVWSVLKLGLQVIWGTLKGAVTSPLAMLDATSRRPGVPWAAFILLLIWSAVEATIFTFTLRPTMSELLADLTGYEVNAFALVTLLWIFLGIIVAGSFACIQVLNDAIKAKETGNIVFMIAVEIAVAMFEVLFLYREMVDAMTPWLAQQGVTLGVIGTLSLAFFAWVGVRGMTWFLFGRFGAPALIAVLSRQPMGEGASAHGGASAMTDYWKGPIAALKAEREWSKGEARRMFELISLPVLQVVAAGLNFLFVVFTGRGHFALPFKSIDDVLAATHFPARVSGEVAR